MAYELSVEDGLLLKGDRIVIPPSLQAGTLTKLHESHQGIEKSACAHVHACNGTGLTATSKMCYASAQLAERCNLPNNTNPSCHMRGSHLLASCALAYCIFDVAVNPVSVHACTCAHARFRYPAM